MAALTHTFASIKITTVRTELHPPGADSGRTFDVRAYLVGRGSELMLIDTLTPGNEDLIGTAISDVGLTWENISDIVLTHGHMDHIGSLEALALRATNARISAGAPDVARMPPMTGRVVHPLATSDEVMGFQVISTPGHTPGHISLFDPDNEVLFPGDIVGNFGGLMRPPPGFNEDEPQAETGLVVLSGLAFECAFFGHGDPIISNARKAFQNLPPR
jgi:glyoxylase-like metal-dependent hydrolase (beta-lactamase superfamily II)